MKDTVYFKQAKLLLQVLPLVEKTRVFALKGGTAINFFLRDMPRLSVDIDLTYVPLNTREEALGGISQALKEISSQAKKHLDAQVEKAKLKGTDLIIKLLIRSAGVSIKVEPNLVLRGTLYPTFNASLRPKVEEMFELAVSTTILNIADLYGGKICAALDRQHPRDFFDIKHLMDNEGITDDIRKSFLVHLASHDRPMHELLKPKWKDIAPIYDSEFKGMTTDPVELKDLHKTRDRLLGQILEGMTKSEKEFLISLKAGTPKWDLLGVTGADKLPGVRWKLENISRMSAAKRSEQLSRLKKALRQ